MTPTPVDPERLASFIDGRMAPSEREAFMAELARAPDDVLAILADVAAAQAPESGAGAARDEAVSPAAAPVRAQAAARRRAWPVPAAALALAAALLLVVRLRTPSNGPDGDDTSLGACQAAAGHATLCYGRALAAATPVASRTSEQWDVRRGPGEGDLLSESARAARLGVLLTELSASAPGDTAVPGLWGHVATLLEGASAGAPLAARARAMASAPLRMESLDTLSSYIERAVAPGDLRAGAVAEAIRRAAVSRDTVFLQRMRGERDLGSPSAPAARGAWERLVTLVRRGGSDAAGETARLAAESIEVITR